MRSSIRCPFCAANFSIYARLEDATKDTAYFLLHNNLQDRIKHDAHHNKRSEKITSPDNSS